MLLLIFMTAKPRRRWLPPPRWRTYMRVNRGHAAWDHKQPPEGGQVVASSRNVITGGWRVLVSFQSVIAVDWRMFIRGPKRHSWGLLCHHHQGWDAITWDCDDTDSGADDTKRAGTLFSATETTPLGAETSSRGTGVSSSRTEASSSGVPHAIWPGVATC